MDIIVHRGSHQIGGMVTEIRTAGSRIFIDMGSELPDENGIAPQETLAIAGVTNGEAHCDAVFFTHYHGDHIGMLSEILPGVPLYMGEAAKDIYYLLQKRVRSLVLTEIAAIKTFHAREKVVVGDITVTPYSVDHSAFDSYMFLIEADGNKVLHTGDFRMHGFRKDTLLKVLQSYIGTVDVLITEGTMLSREGREPKTEQELQNEFRGLFKKYKYVFVLCASTNIDRLASLNQATPRGKYFLCDEYQKSVLELAKKYGSQYSKLYEFNKVTTIGKNIEEKIEKQGFCMLIRPGGQFEDLVSHYKSTHNDESYIVYSMWRGYLSQPGNKMKALMDGFHNSGHHHTSGHASKQAILSVCEETAPNRAIIPVHTENPEALKNLKLKFPVKVLKDGEVFTV